MTSLQSRYQQSSAYWADKNDGGWQDWFNPDIPSDLAYPAETEFVEDVMTEMLEAGETCWGNPRWIRDLWALLKLWSEEEKFIRVRLFSEWLLSTFPTEPIDAEMVLHLGALSRGEFHCLTEPQDLIMR